MAEERPQRRSGRVGTPGIVAAVALVAIAGAWLVTTFGGGVAGAYDGTMDRMFSPSDEELRAAATDYIRAFVYEGSDGGEFRTQVEPEIVTDTYYGSEWDLVSGTAEELDESEATVRWEYKLREVQIEQKARDEATVTAKYKERAYEDGDFDYSVVNRETMELVERDDEWKVARVTDGQTLQSNEAE